MSGKLLLHYMSCNGINTYTPKTGLDFLSDTYGIFVDTGFYCETEIDKELKTSTFKKKIITSVEIMKCVNL